MGANAPDDRAASGLVLRRQAGGGQPQKRRQLAPKRHRALSLEPPLPTASPLSPLCPLAPKRHRFLPLEPPRPADVRDRAGDERALNTPGGRRGSAQNRK